MNSMPQQRNAVDQNNSVNSVEDISKAARPSALNSGTDVQDDSSLQSAKRRYHDAAVTAAASEKQATEALARALEDATRRDVAKRDYSEALKTELASLSP